MNQELRTDLDGAVTAIADAIQTPGQLGYVIGKLVDEAIIDMIGDPAAVKTVIGVLEASKLDFYQRHAVPLTIGDLHGE